MEDRYIFVKLLVDVIVKIVLQSQLNKCCKEICKVDPKKKYQTRKFIRLINNFVKVQEFIFVSLVITTVATGQTSSATPLRSTSSPPRRSRRVRHLDHPWSLSTFGAGQKSTVPPSGSRDCVDVDGSVPTTDSVGT